MDILKPHNRNMGNPPESLDTDASLRLLEVVESGSDESAKKIAKAREYLKNKELSEIEVAFMIRYIIPFLKNVDILEQLSTIQIKKWIKNRRTEIVQANERAYKLSQGMKKELR